MNTKSPGPGPLAELSDKDLMERIARVRDRDAFDQLLERHRHAAFNLGLHLTHDVDMAEDALQDGVLSAWTAAPTYRPTGSVRGWLLKIVVRACLAERRRRRREREKILMLERDENRRPVVGACVEETGREELLAGLRNCVSNLDDQSRQLLAMYFGAEMSQEEIGEALALKQSTVSRRILELQEDLRRKLERMGFALSLTLLNAEQLQEVLCSGSTEPPGLREKILARIVETARQSVRTVVEPSAGKTAGLAWTALGIVACVSAGLAAWMLYGSAPQRAAQRLHIRWNFTERPSDDELKVIAGSWTWQEGREGRHGMAVPSGQTGTSGVLVQFPVPVKFPARVTLRTGGVSVPGSLCQCAVEYLDPPIPGEVWFNSDSAPVESRVSHTLTCYLLGRYNVEFIDGELVVLQTEVPPASRLQGLRLINWMVEEVELQELEPDELPPEVRDVEALRARGNLVRRK